MFGARPSRSSRQHDVVLSTVERDKLAADVVRVLGDPGSAQRLLRQIGYPVGLVPDFADVEADWLEVLRRFDDRIIEAPYRRLLLAAREYFEPNSAFRLIYERHRLDLGVAAAAGPEPPLPRDGQEYVLDRIVVEGPDRRRFELSDVPAHETARGVAENVLLDNYPQTASPVLVDHVRAGLRRAVHLDSTLQDADVRTGDELFVATGYRSAGDLDLPRPATSEGRLPEGGRHRAADGPSPRWAPGAGRSIAGGGTERRAAPSGLPRSRAHSRAGVGLRSGFPNGPEPGSVPPPELSGPPHPAGSPAPAGPPTDEPTELHVRAQIDPEVGLHKTCPILVIVARESLGTVSGAAESADLFAAAGDAALTIEAIKRNHAYLGYV